MIAGSERKPPTTTPVRVYSPEPLIGHPITLLRSIAADISAGRELAWRLFVRDLSALYRQTYLGYVWVFVPPLAAALTFVFLNSQGIIKIEVEGIPYPAFAMMGTLLWQSFVDGVGCAPSAVGGAKAMLAKVNFPREALLMGGLYMVVFNMIVRLLLLAMVMVVWSVTPGMSILVFPVAAMALVGAGFMVGLVIAPLANLYGDIGRAIPVVMPFWMLLTPVVYPARTTGLAGWLATWNPVSPLITTARESLTGAAFSLLPTFALVGAFSLLGILVGLVGFRLAMPHIIARMGN